MTHTATGAPAGDRTRHVREAGTPAKDKMQDASRQSRGRVRDEVDRRSTDAAEQAGAAA